MKNKIIARIFGGIGNQLFCYAAARHLALKNNAELVIDHQSGFIRDIYKRQYQLDHFNISSRKANNSELLYPFPRFRRYFLKMLNKNRLFLNKNYIVHKSYKFEPRLLMVKPKDFLYLEGYWQSENYFKDIEATIRSDLIIKDPIDSSNQNLLSTILDNESVAVHFRFFDANHNNNNNAPSIYYDHAIKYIESMIPSAHYFIFSDMPDKARSLVSLPNSKTTIVSFNNGDSNAYRDLYLMSRCKHFIIANSTFSWWGAWLSNNNTKIVISPDFSPSGGITHWNFDKLIPDSWIVLK